MFGYLYLIGSSIAALCIQGTYGAFIPQDPIAKSKFASPAFLRKRDVPSTPDRDVSSASDGILAPLSIASPITENGRCGVDYGTRCENDECCSSEGWCGTGYLYCSAPACQFEYGPRCDANRRPDGADTEDWPRYHVGDVPYGEAIFHCTEPGTVALTFDDGPWEYTEELLDILEENGVRATFFITGRNLGKGAINDPSHDWARLIHRMKADGHQIGSHTWSHQRLPNIGKSRLRQQMIYNEIAIADILGFFPTYMRPPYSASDEDVDRWLGELGYHITYFNLDTEGYLHEEEIEISENIAKRAIDEIDPDTDSYLHIEHDTVSESVRTLIPYMINLLYRDGFRPVTVGECLGDPEENWYRSPDGRNEKRSLELNQHPDTAEAANKASRALKFPISIPKKIVTPTNLPLGIKNPVPEIINPLPDIKNPLPPTIDNPLPDIIENPLPPVLKNPLPSIKDPLNPDIEIHLPDFKNPLPDIKNPLPPNIENPLPPNIENTAEAANKAPRALNIPIPIPKKIEGPKNLPLGIKNPIPDIENPLPPKIKDPLPDIKNPLTNIENSLPIDINNPVPDIKNRLPDIKNPLPPKIENPLPNVENPLPLGIKNPLPDIKNRLPDIKNPLPSKIKNPLPNIKNPLHLNIKNPLQLLKKIRLPRLNRHHDGDEKPNFPVNGSSPINDTLPLIYPIPTMDGRCGRAFGNTTCMNQKIENCCSNTGWCGSTEDHCMDGCQEGFGRCGMFG